MKALALALWIGGGLGAFFLGKNSNPTPDSPEARFHNAKQNSSRTPSPSTGSVTSSLDPFLQLGSSVEFQQAFTELSPQLQDSQTHDQLFLLADQWASLHPEEAVRWLDELHFNDARNPFLFSALTQWARLAPQVASSWLTQNYPEDSPSRDYLLAAFVRGLSQTDPAQALDLLLASSPSPERSGALDFLLTTWSQQGLSHAFTQVEQLPTSEKKLRQRALDRLLANLLPSELPQAKTLTENLTDPLEKEKALTALASKWAQYNIDEALQWVSQIEHPFTRAKAHGTLATQWSRQDPYAVSQWLSQKNGPTYDYARRSLAGSLIAHDPTTALSQIARITNPQLQNLTFEQLGRIWLSRDPQGFRATMETETLMPPEIRQSLLQNFE